MFAVSAVFPCWKTEEIGSKVCYSLLCVEVNWVKENNISTDPLGTKLLLYCVIYFLFKKRDKQVFWHKGLSYLFAKIT